MNPTLKTRKKLSIGAFAVVTLLAVTMVTPIAQANVVYSTPSAPTNVTSYLSARGVVVKWTPSATATPAITHYVVSAGSGSCPILVPVTSHSVVTMPVVVGQPGGTPVVQAVNAYGFSAAAKSNKSYTADQLAKSASASNIKSVQVLQLSDLHGAIEASASNIGAAVLTTAFANDRKNAAATITLSSGDNIGAAPPISTEFEEMPTIESMNLMKFDASTFGNHEHDRNLAHVQKVIGASDFQWVVSNYGDSTLAALKSGTKAAKSYSIIERGGVKIGIVGSNTDTTIEQVFPGNLDYIDASGVKQMLIDCCDGEVARWRNTKSPMGIFLDKLGHYGAESLIPICFGLRLADWPNQPITSSIYPYLGALLAVLIIINKALNDAVHVARAFSGLPKLEDAKGVNLPRKGALRFARKAFNFLPAHRIFHSVEFTMYVAIFGSFAISLQIALIIALFVTAGHILAITIISKLIRANFQLT